MKKLLAGTALIAVCAAFGGCNQQQQSGGSAVVSGPDTFRTPEEIRQLEQIAQSAPKNANAWTQFGNALMDARRFSEAVDAYQKSLALEPNNVDVRVDLGTCFRGIGKPELAMDEYRKAIKINPRHPNAHRNSGVVLAFDLKKNLEAAAAFERYLEVAPAAADALEIRQIIQQLRTKP